MMPNSVRSSARHPPPCLSNPRVSLKKSYTLLPVGKYHTLRCRIFVFPFLTWAHDMNPHYQPPRSGMITTCNCCATLNSHAAKEPTLLKTGALAPKPKPHTLKSLRLFHPAMLKAKPTHDTKPNIGRGVCMQCIQGLPKINFLLYICPIDNQLMAFAKTLKTSPKALIRHAFGVR